MQYSPYSFYYFPRMQYQISLQRDGNREAEKHFFDIFFTKV